MKKYPAMLWYTGDWRKDVQTHLASLPTRALWREMLDCMWDAPERGRLTGSEEQLAKLLVCTVEELRSALAEIQDLKIGNVFVTKNANVTNSHIDVTIENRRMLREEKVREGARNRQFKHRHNILSQKYKEAVTQKVTKHSSYSYSKQESKDSSDVGCLSKLSNLWNSMCPSLPQVREMGKKRRAHESSRLKQRTLEEWSQIFSRIENTPFLRGENKTSWRATFDWIIANDENAARVLEGKYDTQGISNSILNFYQEASDVEK